MVANIINGKIPADFVNEIEECAGDITQKYSEEVANRLLRDSK